MMQIVKRPGKFQWRAEIDWNDYDPWDVSNWCKKYIKDRSSWFRKDIKNAEYDWTFYFYFKQDTDLTLFTMKWS